MHDINEAASELADFVIDEFEDLLDKHKIMIPDKARTGAKGEAPIYGATYDELVERINNLTEASFKEVLMPILKLSELTERLYEEAKRAGVKGSAMDEAAKYVAGMAIRKALTEGDPE